MSITCSQLLNSHPSTQAGRDPEVTKPLVWSSRIVRKLRAWGKNLSHIAHSVSTCYFTSVPLCLGSFLFILRIPRSWIFPLSFDDLLGSTFCFWIFDVYVACVCPCLMIYVLSSPCDLQPYLNLCSVGAFPRRVSYLILDGQFGLGHLKLGSHLELAGLWVCRICLLFSLIWPCSKCYRAGILKGVGSGLRLSGLKLWINPG